jgi:tetratricopeptide (TPR) repeat protein
VVPGRATLLVSALLISAAWSVKTSDYLGEWCDPRTVWHYSAPRVNNGLAYEFLGNVYHNSADRISALSLSVNRGAFTNELPLASAVLGDLQKVEALRTEWAGSPGPHTNSNAYVDRLLGLAWDNYQLAVAFRGRVSEPDLYMRRGALLASQGKTERANREYHKALELAMSSLMSARAHHRNATAFLRYIGLVYWNMRDYQTAKVWYLKAQQEQKRSGEIWVPSLDEEVDRISRHAAGQ